MVPTACSVLAPDLINGLDEEMELTPCPPSLAQGIFWRLQVISLIMCQKQGLHYAEGPT